MKRVLRDGCLILEKQMRFGAFQHTLMIDEHTLTIVEQGDRYDLRIDSQPFSLLYLSERNKSSFKPEGTGYSDMYPKPSYPGAGHSYPAEPGHHSVSMGYPSKKPAAPKKDPLEFNTGFDQFDYKPSPEYRPQQKMWKPAPAEQPASYEWRQEPEIRQYNKSASMAPQVSAAQEDFSWDKPSGFEFEEGAASRKPATAARPGIFAPPPASAARAPAQPAMAAPAPVAAPVKREQPPKVEVKKEEPKPIIDFLDSGPQNTLPPDLFEGESNEPKISPVIKPKEDVKPAAPAAVEGFFGTETTAPPLVSAAPLTPVEEKKAPAMDMAGFIDLKPEPKKVETKPAVSMDLFSGSSSEAKYDFCMWI